MPPTRVSLVLSLAVAVLSSEARGAEKGFFSRYNVGVTYEVSSSYAQIAYDADTMASTPDDCAVDEKNPSQMHCRAFLAPDEDATPSPGLYLAQPFKRTGWFAFDWGFTVSSLAYKGGIVTQPRAPQPAPRQGGSSGPQKPVPKRDQPLDHAYLELYGLSWQTYLQVGITPRYLPDIFYSLGVGLQTVGGKVRVLEEQTRTFLVQPDAYGELEAVFARFGEGALGVYLSQHQSLRSDAKLMDDYPSNSRLKNLVVSLQSSAAGVRLLLPF